MSTLTMNLSSDHSESDDVESMCHTVYDIPCETDRTSNQDTNSMSICTYEEDEQEIPSHVDESLTHNEYVIATNSVNVVLEEDASETKGDEDESITDCDQFTLFELIGVDVDQVPHYLRTVDSSFEKLIRFMQPILSKQDLEEFRSVAIVMHKVLLVEKLIHLWQSYRKSSFVPLNIAKKFQQSHPDMGSGTIDAHGTRLHEPFIRLNVGESETRCQAFIDECLKRLSEKCKECYDQLHLHTSHLTDHAYSMKQTVQKFIKQQFRSQSLEYDCHIESVQYQYIGALLQQEFADELPNERHMNLFESLSKLKYKEALSKYHFEGLQYIQSKTPKESRTGKFFRELQSLFLCGPEIKRFEDLSLCIANVKKDMQHSREQFNHEFHRMNENEKTLPVEKRLTLKMVSLLRKHLSNIQANLENITKYRIELFQLQSI